VYSENKPIICRYIILHLIGELYQKIKVLHREKRKYDQEWNKGLENLDGKN